MSQATVRIPTPLRPLTGGSDEVAAVGQTVGEVLSELGGRHIGFLDRILDQQGKLRSFVNVYLGDSNVRSLNGLDSAVVDGSVIHIVPAVAGGCDARDDVVGDGSAGDRR